MSASFHPHGACSLKRSVLLAVCLMWTVASRVRADLDDSMSSWREAKVRLKEKILSHKVSTAKVSPANDNFIDIRILFWPIQVLTIDELQQSITTVSYVVMSWRDKDLAWERMDYENISLVSLNYQDLWHPNLVISNSVDEDANMMHRNERLLLDDTGRVHLTLPFFSKTSCNLDFTNYPFDQQECDVIVFPFFDDCTITLTPDNVTILTDPFKISGEWSIEASSSDTEMYTWGQKTVPILRVKMLLRRSVLFYVITILLPMSVTSLMTSLVFWIPPSSGEKVTFLVTIYVSATVFINFVSDTMPRSLSDLPRITIFLVTFMLQCFFALMATLFVIRRHGQQQLLVGDSRDSRDFNVRRSEMDAPAEGVGSSALGTKVVTKDIEGHSAETTGPHERGLVNNRVHPFSGESSSGLHSLPETRPGDCVLSCKVKVRPRMVRPQLKAEQWDLIFFVMYHVATVPCYISMLLPLFQ